MAGAVPGARGARRVTRLLAAARGGNEEAFRRLVDPYRGELRAHCARMLGSVDESEDVMQEVLLRAWRALGRFEGRASLRAWLYRIATNACINAIERRRRTALPVDDGPFDCPCHEADGDGEPERRDRFEAALRSLVDLPPNQRAAVILKDVLGFSARESAEALATTPASVNSALQRARTELERTASASAEPRPRANRAGAGELLASLVAAFARDDVSAVLAIAAETVPPGDRAWAFSPVPAY
jgi:RNA polymerase sigma-70 factor, ECF subfamily